MTIYLKKLYVVKYQNECGKRSVANDNPKKHLLICYMAKIAKVSKWAKWLG